MPLSLRAVPSTSRWRKAFFYFFHIEAKMTGMKQIKLPCTRGFRWRAVITSNDSIRRPGIPRQKSGLKYPQSLQSFLSMNHINIKKKISVNSSVRFNSFWNETGHLTREKLAQSRHAIRLAGVYSVDFDGRREMLSLSLKTGMAHKSVKSLTMRTNTQKGGIVNRVSCAKFLEKLQLQEFFQSLCMLFCN